MSGFLIPIKELTPEVLAAVQFALEFGKRNGGIFFFLFVQEATSVPAAPDTTVSEGSSNTVGRSDPNGLQQSIESQILQARESDGLQVETECRHGDFVQAVHDFVREHHIDEIILGVSEELKDPGAKAHQNARLLFQLTRCRILTVKPKIKEHEPQWSQLR